MTDPRTGIARITSITRTVPDLRPAARFYEDALDCVPDGNPLELPAGDCVLLGVEPGQVRSQVLHLGAQQITLLQFSPRGRAYPEDGTATDLWFQHCAVVVGDVARACARVTNAGATPISDGPQHLPANTGAVTAYKFRDPFGHPMELLSLPGNVGDPVWHRGNPGLFLGIDHTAIAVSDRASSEDFYTGVLGLSVRDRTRNRGPAQVRLDAVPDDVVDVVALAPDAAPPHLELLAYHAGTRRSLAAAGPADSATSRTLAVGDVEHVSARLRRHGRPVRRGSWEGRPAIAFDDPDGHGWICRAA